MQIKSPKSYFTFIRLSILKEENNKCWHGYREIGTILYCWWECKIEQLLWKQSVRSSEVTLKFPHNTLILFWGTYQENEIYMSMQILVLDSSKHHHSYQSKVKTMQMSFNRRMDKVRHSLTVEIVFG